MDAPPLTEVLAEAKALGFLGPGPVDDHIRHAQAFVEATPPPTRFLDLGSGGGVPGLVLGLAWPAARGVLLDASAKRTAYLRRAVIALGLCERLLVVTARAEEGGHLPELRASFEVVAARSFGSPALTAECGACFLRPGGRLLVAEPPDRPDRWPADVLGQCGLEVAGGTGPVRALVLTGTYPDDWPRRRPGR